MTNKQYVSITVCNKGDAYMTKKTKKEIRRIWKLVGSLQGQIELNLKRIDISRVIAIVEECQKAAIAVGESLERCCKEETEVVQQLELYCEMIYQMSQLQIDSMEWERCIGDLQKKHEEIEGAIEALVCKKEIVFLPYKYSMWDSLESIYFAAEQDPECEAYVIPIPYIELGKENEAPAWIFEGDNFPDTIPITSYQNYDMEEHHPDVIYIHNPYDEYNNVTSVAPQFYSTELKKNCQKLVYVPYFYVGGLMPREHVALPTYTNMDYIVVPTVKAVENMKSYVDASKLLPMGSPKIDCMIKENRNRVIPEQWRSFIQDKKIVLYNVSLTAILSKGMRTIEKMRYVFQYFENQDKLVLWWRPHPLLKSTIQSMRPDLLEAYEQLELEFVQKEIGIYDTTPYSNKAVAVTDAFLGDWSSLANMYGITGKPIFYTDNLSVEEPTKEERRNVWMMSSVIQRDGTILFYAPQYNSICRYDVEQEKVKLIRQTHYIYTNAIEYVVIENDNLFVLSPTGRDQRFGIYNKKTNHMEWSEIEKPNISANYNRAYFYQNEILFAPQLKDEICCYNCSNKKYTYYGGYEKELKKYRELPDEILFGGELPTLVDGKLFLLSYRVNIMLEFDMRTKRYKLHEIGDERQRFSEFSYDGEDFWFAKWDGTGVVRWNMKENRTTLYAQLPENYIGFYSEFCSQYTPAIKEIIPMNNGVYVFPYVANMILKLNPENGEMEEYHLDIPYLEGQRKNSLYNCASNYIMVIKYDESHILAQTAYDESLLLINVETNEVRRMECRYSEEDYKKLDRSMEHAQIQVVGQPLIYYQEHGTCQTLKDMMDYFASGADMHPERQIASYKDSAANLDGTCGEKIHQYIMKELVK